MSNRVEALVVNTVRRGPGQLTGMGDAGTDLLNVVTAGGYNDLLGELDQVDTALKVSIAASAIAAGVFLWMIFGGER